MKEIILQAAGVCKSFAAPWGGMVEALDNISMILPRGQLTALVGPDGAGKTTLLRLICGLIRPDAGTLQVLGHETTQEAQAIQSLLSYMPQKFGLYEDLTVSENIHLYASLHGVDDAAGAARFAHLLELTGMAPFTGRLAGKLSGGMKQKLGLICTLVRSPELLLLDEPTVGVDPLSRRELWQILQQLTAEEGLSVLVSTAYLEEAALCAQVYVMSHGHFLAQGTPAELSRLARGRCYQLEPVPGLQLRTLQDRLLREECVTDAVPAAGRIRLLLDQETRQPQEIGIIRQLGLPAVPAAPRLEDSFMLLLHAEAAARGEEEAQLPATGIDILPAADAGPVDIEVRDLVKKFGDFTAVAHTSFQVHRGEVFGLLGPNGAGKTTTFRMLCGLLSATAGELYVAGVDVRRARARARQALGYVAQKFSLYAGLTVRENLRFFGGEYGLYGRELQERIEEAAVRFGLTAKLEANSGLLPQGYKQRLAMACALLHHPKILFLDEPTSGIDPLARRRFWQQITTLSEQGTTIIVTTHFMEEAEYCDRFMIQDQGRLLVLGSPQQVRAELGLPEAEMNEIFLAVVERGRRQTGGES